MSILNRIDKKTGKNHIARGIVDVAFHILHFLVLTIYDDKQIKLKDEQRNIQKSKPELHNKIETIALTKIKQLTMTMATKPLFPTRTKTHT